MTDIALKIKGRDSNMELLRIVAMLLVMMVHADFRALPVPSCEETHTDMLSSFLRFFTEGASIICVNVFILLSGWYGIRFKVSRLAEFLFQVLFFGVVCCLVYVIFNPGKVGVVEAIANIFLFKGWAYWFVKAYLGLYILSPVLNAFVKAVSQKEFCWFLFLFYFFQTLYGWMSNGAMYFMEGYSALSFSGLYLLARYVRLYPNRYTRLQRQYDMIIYGILTLVMSVSAFVITYLDIPEAGSLLWKYTSPLVIVSALHFLLFFSKISFSNKFVNYVAASSFAIYLIHSNAFLAKPYYDDIIKGWFYSQDSTLMFICMTAGLLAGYFVVAILLDKVRIFCWRKLESLFY